MKTLIATLLVLATLIGCNIENEREQESPIYSTWKLIETYGSDGDSEPKWTTINNGYVYTFKKDGRIITNRFICNGSYQILNNTITIDFNCPSSQFNLTYSYTIENEYLVLVPDPINCDEGCSEKFKKMNM